MGGGSDFETKQHMGYIKQTVGVFFYDGSLIFPNLVWAYFGALVFVNYAKQIYSPNKKSLKIVVKFAGDHT